MRVAVIGHGYWGKNMTRVLAESSAFELVSVCDSSPSALAPIARRYPGVQTVSSIDELPPIDAVAIATPASQHHGLAKRFLSAGKHVWLAKPCGRSLAEAVDLDETARTHGATLFVDYTFVFNPSVRKMKELLPRVGVPYFVLAQRLNLGIYQSDVNVIYDLLPHDVSIISYLLDTSITHANTFAVAATGLPQEDLAHSSITTASGVNGLLTVSWLSPHKIRQLIIVGSMGMLSYDDVAVAEKVKFYDRGIDLRDLQSPGSLQAYTSRISYRSGDLFSPAIPNTEALAFEVEELARAIKDSTTRNAYADLNLRIMRGMECITEGVGPNDESR